MPPNDLKLCHRQTKQQQLTIFRGPEAIMVVGFSDVLGELNELM
jgi:hypothetical protein